MSDPVDSRATDQLDDPDHIELPPPRRSSRLGDLRGPALLVVGVLVAYGIVGVAAGWLWHEVWTPANGVVVGHQWYASGDALRDDFSGTGIYVVVATVAGLVLGLVSAVLGGRRPLVTVVAAVAGSALAAYLMTTVGQGLGPEDPHTLAAKAADGKELPSALAVTGFSPTLAFTFGTLVALAVVYTMFPGKTREARLDEEPRR
jgi:hypothetical protein